jgi:hypothetical protein
MVEIVSARNDRYQQGLMSVFSVPVTSYGRATLREEGVADKLFISFLFSNNVGI